MKVTQNLSVLSRTFSLLQKVQSFTEVLHKRQRGSLITAERHKSDFPSGKVGAMWLSIVICVIQRGSVRLPLYFALTLVYKARNRPTGHTENQEGSCICFNPVCKQLSADLRQRGGSGNEFCPCEGKQGVLRADLYPECSLWHVCHSHHFLS